MHFLFNPNTPVKNAIILYFMIIYLTYYYKPSIIFDDNTRCSTLGICNVKEKTRNISILFCICTSSLTHLIFILINILNNK